MDRVESALDMGKRLTHCKIFAGFPAAVRLKADFKDMIIEGDAY